MFDTISGEYDGLNRIISLGSMWNGEKKVVALVQKHRPQSILTLLRAQATWPYSLPNKPMPRIL